MIEKFLTMLDKRIKAYIDEAYKQGYKIGEDDATRRMHEMYNYGLANGYITGKAEIEEIDLNDIKEMMEE